MGVRKGFTLIELLEVIAIIALLMAILMPALQRVKSRARGVACQSNLKQMGYTFTLYTEGRDPHHSWVPAMRPYYSHEPKNSQLPGCP